MEVKLAFWACRDRTVIRYGQWQCSSIVQHTPTPACAQSILRAIDYSAHITFDGIKIAFFTFTQQQAYNKTKCGIWKHVSVSYLVCYQRITYRHLQNSPIRVALDGVDLVMFPYVQLLVWQCLDEDSCPWEHVHSCRDITGHKYIVSTIACRGPGAGLMLKWDVFFMLPCNTGVHNDRTYSINDHILLFMCYSAILYE